ncbi:SDR family NAD(P)-dependent oxidoreductase [Streptomyces sp. PTM05]|uniref:SDR family NAD(P)-dependent oxidoreductase n=1 Tax=Streptantibioticus parmotrematis TaxID=2873249 RepID=A0ABS7QQ44_9ACTN|nr:type I polyketide synthase [Streptantibioticus parmotrematis]MBY8885297.1 SDR family NAD(P)-dependent oxidoreductase [Streptantibioticus parmotrematis]
MSSVDERSRTAEPVAVVGMSCRLPGAASPREFWRLLRAGGEADGGAPAGRLSEGGAKEHDLGRFIEGADRFDAAFFGIPPAEAAAMDPQQRLTLELAWEALEDARILPASVRDTATGVFVGAITGDYAQLHDRLGESALSRHSVTGTHRSLIANRVSYLFGLRGASLVVDSGQSSSLVAVRLACEELRRGACDLALAGGVNLNLLDGSSAALGRLGALSPDGRCHTFDQRANGYVRGEGGGMVVLKPLSAALADGDPVHCVILGGAVNNDGGGEGLTVPTARAQEEVVRAACGEAGVAPESVRYVELHGTGTAVGDPVEAAALGAALTAGRAADRPLLVGSAKGNVGHLEGAAGITGLIKVALTLRHRTLVPTPTFETPSDRIPLADLRLDVVRTVRDWPGENGQLVAGVSAFGMGGTNCHLVLASNEPATSSGHAETPDTTEADGEPAPWILSARSHDALRGQARALAAHLADRPDARPADIALSLARTRTLFEQRAVLLGADRDQLISSAKELADGKPGARVIAGRATTGGCAFIFPGQGSQWTGMARELLTESAPFASRVAECAEALAPYVDYDLLAVLREEPGAPGHDRVDVVQPALWAVMVGLAEVWRSRGVRPAAVLGHSQGEIAAATVTGALSLPDAARVVALRARALSRVAGGRMLSVAAPRDVVAAELPTSGVVTVAVVNSPRATVLAGPQDELAALRELFEARGLRSRPVAIDYASHTAAVEAVRDEILTALAPIAPVSTDIPFHSAITGQPVDTATLDAEYWYRSLRSPVRFADSTRAALDAGCTLFVECSPHPMLLGAVQETAEEAGREAAAVGTLRRDEGGRDRLRRSLAEAFTRGAPVDWRPEHDTPGARLTDLPTYAFQRERHWIGEAPRPRATTPRTAVSSQDDRSRTLPTPAALLRTVTDAAAVVLGHTDGTALDPTRSFRDLGFDSMGTVELRDRLTAITGLPLPTTVTYEYPTPERLAGRLHALLDGDRTDAAPQTPENTTADATDPIAIVGMACRYPGGVTTPEELWRLVADGTDAISELPTDRGWDLDTLLGDGPGRLTSAYGGFLHDAPQFDAAFFGLSPREALAMDPQQRLVLETSWEALERAGLDPAALSGRPVGVFVGAMAAEYGPRLAAPAGAGDGHLLTGTALSVASGRVAYTLGLTGPALTVDTACSSSLVAVHLAVQSLRRGECPMALAGGVTVMAGPGNLVEFSRQNGLAPDGRAKAFSVGADGTSFAEGCGVLVLERLSDALRAGHPVHGVIRGTAINQDGASNGLTAPDGQAQRRLIRQALADARLDAGDVDAIEAHGTGTALGDPIEANALIDTYGRGAGRGGDRPVWLGSVKSNIGHTQAAAGVAGVIKMVEAMRHETLPRTLHADEPTTKAEWDNGNVRILTSDQRWPRRADGTRRAAVSSFGISGTNAHVVLEEPRHTAEVPLAARPDATPIAWPLTARTDNSLRTQAGRIAEGYDGHDLDGVAATLAGRTRFERRAVALGTDATRLLDALHALRDGHPASGLVTGTARRDPRLAVVFSGQGGQRLGMGRGLYEAFPVFAGAFDGVCGVVDGLLGRSLREVLWAVPGGGAAGLVDETGFTQPGLFAFEVALFRLLGSWGVVPGVVAGHSVGEFAAACVAGLWDVGDAARLVVARGRLMQGLPSGGGMFAVAAGEGEVLGSLAGLEGRVAVAAVNSPVDVVISGEVEACRAVAEVWVSRGRRVSRLPVSHAFHSPLMEPMLEEFRAELGSVEFREPVVAYEPAVGGGRSWSDPEYWVDQVRGAVRFADLVGRLEASGTGVFVEVGPRAVLSGMVRASLSPQSTATVTATARRDEPEEHAVLRAAAEAFTVGVDVDWEAVRSHRTGAADRVVPAELPTYAFDRRRFWLTDRDTTTGDRPSLLERAVPVAHDGGHLLTGRLSRRSIPWLADHTIGDDVLVPGTAFVELALHAAATCGATMVGELALHAPLLLPASGAVEVQVAVGGEDEDGRRELTVHARPADDPTGPWTRHATGRLESDRSAAPAGPEDWAVSWPPEGARRIDLDGVYERLAEAGYVYGPAFQGLVGAWRSGDDHYAEVRLPDASRETAGEFLAHPALLDSVLHVLVLDALDDPAGGGRPIPFAFTEVSVERPGADRLRVRLSRADDGGVRLDLCDGGGERIGAVGSVTLRQSEGVRAPAETDTGALYDVAWMPVDFTEAAAARGARPRWAVLGQQPFASATADALVGAGIDASVHRDLEELAAQPEPVDVAIVCGAPDDGTPVDAPQAARRALHTALDLVRGRATDERLAATRLVFLADPFSAAGAPVWGLVRSAQAEHPGAFTLAALRDAAPDAWRRLIAAVTDGEPQFAVDGELTRVPRLVRRPPADIPTSDPGDQPRTSDDRPLATGTVLITGGTGGLGGWLAEHLVDRHDARDLLLVSRSGPEAPGAADLKARLESRGATVRVAACDVAERGDLARLLETVPRLAAVVHTAGVLADCVVDGLGPDRLETVLRPKADGAWLLHELTRDRPLKAFVLFSSVAGVLGHGGQANYAAANGFLDALAAHRGALGLPATSIAWGLWSSAAGMAAGLTRADEARLSRTGALPLERAQGLALFDTAFDGSSAVSAQQHSPFEAGPVVAARWDLAGLRAKARAGAVLPAVLHGLARVPRRTADTATDRSAASRPNGRQTAGPRDGGLAERLSSLDEVAARRTVLDLVRTQAATVLGHGSLDAIDADRPFTELGLDSLASVELRGNLSRETGLTLPATLIFDHPTVDAVTDHLLRDLAPRTRSAADALADALDQVTALLDRLDDDPGQRDRAGAALQAALRRVRPEPEEPALTEGFGAASDEELFQFIDNQI